MMLMFSVIIVASAIAFVQYAPTSGESQTIMIQVSATKHFGAETMFSQDAYVPAGSSAMDAVIQLADVETKYGGGFVNSINGVESKFSGPNPVMEDWFFYVNGMLADVGAFDYALHEGDVELWDFHDWSFQTYVTAIVGCFPEPFLHGYSGKVYPTVVVYSDNLREDAVQLQNELTKYGVKKVSTMNIHELAVRDKGQLNLIILGTLDSPLVSELNTIHDKLGFYVNFEEKEMTVTDASGRIVEKHGSGSVIQAARNPWNPEGTGSSESVVWLVAGLDEGDVKNAVDILVERPHEIQHAFAVVVVENHVYRVPPC